MAVGYRHMPASPEGRRGRRHGWEGLRSHGVERGALKDVRHHRNLGRNPSAAIGLVQWTGPCYEAHHPDTATELTEREHGGFFRNGPSRLELQAQRQTNSLPTSISDATFDASATNQMDRSIENKPDLRPLRTAPLSASTPPRSSPVFVLARSMSRQSIHIR